MSDLLAKNLTLFYMTSRKDGKKENLMYPLTKMLLGELFLMIGRL